MRISAFGKLVISAGFLMAAVFAYTGIAWQPVESRFGANVAIVFMFIVLTLSAIAVSSFNDRFASRVTIPVGLGFWMVAFVIIYAMFSKISV